jgi:hypothetical protein
LHLISQVTKHLVCVCGLVLYKLYLVVLLVHLQGEVTVVGLDKVQVLV